MSKPDKSSRRHIVLGSLLVLALAAAGLRLLLQEVPRPSKPSLPPVAEVPDTELVAMLPIEEPHGEFIGSDACIECHQGKHRSWSNSWHSTMTQRATLDSFIGDLDLEIESEGNRYSLFEKDGLPWFRIEERPANFSPRKDQRKEFPIVMSTGSHLMQLGWFPIGHSRTLGLLPIAYLKEDRRWVPHSSIFLQPPDSRSSTRVGIWNEGCSRCHTTGPEPRRLDGSTFDRTFGLDTHVAEFGISCEACHGPGRSHVALRRDADPDSPIPHDPIVNPEKLNHKRASEICGACHGDASPRNKFKDTPHHLPGKPLADRYIVNEPPEADDKDSAESTLHASYTDDGSTMYWSDGQARVSGASFSALRISRCYAEGEISCLSCHSLHQQAGDSRPAKEWAKDMLRTDALGDAACLRCHEAKTYGSRAHTIHETNSSGSRCYNCHMPHTSYGLLKAIRSHAITSPSVDETLNTGRLNACNLCHLDKTLEWTNTQLHQHYAHDQHDLSSEHHEVAAAALQALTGDAGQRALIAWAMSWPPAVAASNGDDWIPPHLANLLQDPYSAVRYIAGHSLRSHAGYREFEYNYLASPEELSQQSAALIAGWQSQTAHPTALIQDNGKLNEQRFQELRAQRNDHDIALME